MERPLSAPLFLVGALPSGDAHTLDGPEGHHAATVARLRVGERLLFSDGRGGAATAEVTAVGRGTLTTRILERRYVAAPDPRLVVAQGIPKGDRGELAVQVMTEVGVDEILPWSATRAVSHWRGARGHRSREKWAATAREAAKQARRPWLPLIAGSPDVTTAEVADRLSSAALGLILHAEASDRLATVALPTRGDVMLVVGPEGGIAESELAVFTAAGGVPVHLGSEVLRTSTAGLAALAVLSARLARW